MRCGYHKRRKEKKSTLSFLGGGGGIGRKINGIWGFYRSLGINGGERGLCTYICVCSQGEAVSMHAVIVTFACNR